jgi:hypothetical protein
MQVNPMLSQDPYDLFLFGIKTAETKRKYQNHLDKFFDFLDGGSDKCICRKQKRSTEDIERLRRRCKNFIDGAQEDKDQAFYSIVNFLQFLRERVDRKEITAGTLKNYCKAIRLFCDMSEIDIPWRRITRGLPKPKRYASDRVPTMEIQNAAECE